MNSQDCNILSQGVPQKCLGSFSWGHTYVLNQTILLGQDLQPFLYQLLSFLIHNGHSIRLIDSFLVKMEDSNKAKLLTLFVDFIDSVEIIHVSQQNSCFDHQRAQTLLLALAVWSHPKCYLEKHMVLTVLIKMGLKLKQLSKAMKIWHDVLLDALYSSKRPEKYQTEI